MNGLSVNGYGFVLSSYQNFCLLMSFTQFIVLFLQPFVLIAPTDISLHIVSACADVNLSLEWIMCRLTADLG